MVELNPILRDLLMREAHLRLSREQLKPVWAQKEAELRAVEAEKPFFIPVISNRKREEYLERLAGVRHAVSRLRRGMEAIEHMEPSVKKLLEEQIEEVLREDSPEYAEALAARGQNDDWGRCLERFGGKIQELARALENGRNQAGSGFGRLAYGSSNGAKQTITLALEAATAVETEVKLANKIADSQAGTYLDNGFAIRALPRLAEFDYADGVKKISELPPAEGQKKIDELIEQTKKLGETAIAELKAQAENVDHLQEIEIHHYLLTVWERYRAEVAPQIYAGDTEKIVAETESLLMAKAQPSVMGRLVEVAA